LKFTEYRFVDSFDNLNEVTMKNMSKLLICFLLVVAVKAAQPVIGITETIFAKDVICGCGFNNADEYCSLAPSVPEWIADAKVSVLKKDATTLFWFWPLGNDIQRFEGPLNNPRQTYVPCKKDFNWYATWSDALIPTPFITEDHEIGGGVIVPGNPQKIVTLPSQPVIAKLLPNYGLVWLKKIYKINGDTLLGFCHCESMPEDVYDISKPRQVYSIGLSYSTDNGASWDFIGEIIKPFTSAYDAEHLNNIMGVP
jgi:hypothetical protein